jgi:DNA-binding CsgD family transcriptional regulator
MKSKCSTLDLERMFYYTFPQMSVWQSLKRLLMGSQKKNRKYSLTFGEFLQLQSPPKTVSKISRNGKKRVLDSHTASLFRDSKDDRYQLWLQLSPREQDVTALACLRYTNPQIAARLGLSRVTVKSYLEKVLNKMGLQNKADLRVFFAGWDFSEFERREDPHR